MAIEIEAKMAVKDLEPVRETLGRLGAQRIGRVLETNVFFDTAAATLLAGDQGLRLRTNQDVDSDRRTHVITFKGPLQAGAMKSREEVELDVADAADAGRLLEKLGFDKTLSFEKRRESWKVADCKVELDELPYLGSYVEVEGPGEESVMKVRALLGLAERPIIKTSYIAMLTAHLQERGLDRGEVGFGEV